MTLTIDAGTVNFGTDNLLTDDGNVYNFQSYGYFDSNCVVEWTDGVFEAWIDSYEPAWGICYPGKLNEIYTDNAYVYAAYSKGLDIIDLFSEQKVAYVEYDYGFTSVCGDEYNVYLGTLNSGVLYIDKTTVSGNYDSSVCLNNKLNKMDLRFPIQSNRIKHLFTLNNNLSIVTLEGIDIINFSGQGLRSFTTSAGVVKSFLTSKKELYYISDYGGYKVNKVNNAMCDWQLPDIIYKPGESFMSENIIINDLFVTENTSKLNNFNTLFIATSDGCYVYDEGSEECEIYYNKGHI